MKKVMTLMVVLAFAIGVSAQGELQRLLTTYKESVRMPYYKECKQYEMRIPQKVEKVTTEGGVVVIVYSVRNGDFEQFSEANNVYTVRIELAKSEMYSQNNAIYISCKEGLEITEQNGTTKKSVPFLIETWSIKCNDSPLCNKLVSAIKQLGGIKESVSNGYGVSVEGNAFRKVGNGTGTAGNPVAHGSQGGSSWNVPGRSLRGRLVQPSYAGNEEGKIVVSIRIDKDGRVIAASIGAGTTISSETMRQRAIEAAKKNTFSAGDTTAMGSITYCFKLN